MEPGWGWSDRPYSSLCISPIATNPSPVNPRHSNLGDLQGLRRSTRIQGHPLQCDPVSVNDTGRQERPSPRTQICTYHWAPGPHLWNGEILTAKAASGSATCASVVSLRGIRSGGAATRVPLTTLFCTSASDNCVLLCPVFCTPSSLPQNPASRSAYCLPSNASQPSVADSVD